MKIELTEETVKFMKEFTHNLETQDRRGTADPYYFTIRCHQDYVAPVGHNGNAVYYVSEAEQSFTEEELKEYCEENECDFENTKDKAYEVDLQDIAHNENFFFTKKGYDQHMKMNKHNYNHYKKIYSYVDYACRNPELESVLKLFKEIGAQLI